MALWLIPQYEAQLESTLRLGDKVLTLAEQQLCILNMVPAQLIGIKFNLLTALISLTLRWIWIVVDQQLIFASELRCCCCRIFDRSGWEQHCYRECIICISDRRKNNYIISVQSSEDLSFVNTGFWLPKIGACHINCGSSIIC